MSTSRGRAFLALSVALLASVVTARASLGSGFSGGGGGGASSWTASLAVGATTSGRNPIVSLGDGLGFRGVTPGADQLKWDAGSLDFGSQSVTVNTRAAYGLGLYSLSYGNQAERTNAALFDSTADAVGTGAGITLGPTVAGVAQAGVNVRSYKRATGSLATVDMILATNNGQYRDRVWVSEFGAFGAAAGVWGWTDGVANPTASVTTGLSQVSAGKVAVGNGTTGDTSGEVQLRTTTLTGSSSGTHKLVAPAVAGTLTTTLPPSHVAHGVLTDVAGDGVLTEVVPPGAGVSGTVSVTPSVASTLATLTAASNSATGAEILVTITATDGTDFGLYSTVVHVALVNKAGTFSMNSFDNGGAVTYSSGGKTFLTTFTTGNANQNTIQLTLAPSGWSSGPTCMAYVTVLNCPGAVTVP